VFDDVINEVPPLDSPADKLRGERTFSSIRIVRCQNLLEQVVGFGPTGISE
jgi:hypothetical protein